MSVLHFRDLERLVSRLFPATFLPLSGFSAFPSLLTLSTAILGITVTAEQRASHPAAASAGHAALGSRNQFLHPKNLNADWVQARGTPWQLCITHSHSHRWRLSPQMKIKMSPANPLPFQCCLKQNVNVALGIWSD